MAQNRVNIKCGPHPLPAFNFPSYLLPLISLTFLSLSPLTIRAIFDQFSIYARPSSRETTIVAKMQFKNIALLALSSTAAAEFVIITSTPIPTDIAGALAHVNISHPFLYCPTNKTL
jgi:hypothetical protein